MTTNKRRLSNQICEQLSQILMQNPQAMLTDDAESVLRTCPQRRDKINQQLEKQLRRSCPHYANRLAKALHGEFEKVALPNRENWLASHVSDQWAKIKPQAADEISETLVAIAAKRPDHTSAREFLWKKMAARVRQSAQRFAASARASRGMEVEDLMQESFVKFQTVIARYRPQKVPFRAWWSCVTNNQFIQLVRRRSQHTNDVGDVAETLPDTRHQSAESLAHQHEAAEIVDEVCWALRSTMDPQRVLAFRLRFVYRKKFEVIAALLERCVAWVFTAVTQVEKAFRKEIILRYDGMDR